MLTQNTATAPLPDTDCGQAPTAAAPREKEHARDLNQTRPPKRRAQEHQPPKLIQDAHLPCALLRLAPPLLPLLPLRPPDPIAPCLLPPLHNTCHSNKYDHNPFWVGIGLHFVCCQWYPCSATFSAFCHALSRSNLSFPFHSHFATATLPQPLAPQRYYPTPTQCHSRARHRSSNTTARSRPVPVTAKHRYCYPPPKKTHGRHEHMPARHTARKARCQEDRAAASRLSAATARTHTRRTTARLTPIDPPPRPCLRPMPCPPRRRQPLLPRPIAIQRDTTTTPAAPGPVPPAPAAHLG